MNESTMALYHEIVERYVKVIWTHKIHLCQATILAKKMRRHNIVLAVFSVMVSAAAITNVLKWLPEVIMVPVLALLSLALAFFTILFKAENPGKEAANNEYFAAAMHDLRNRYAGLLCDIKAGLLTDQQIVEQRKALEHEENLIFSGIVPESSAKAVSNAEKALKIKQDSTTTEDEVALLVSKNLQL